MANTKLPDEEHQMRRDKNCKHFLSGNCWLQGYPQNVVMFKSIKYQCKYPQNSVNDVMFKRKYEIKFLWMQMTSHITTCASCCFYSMGKLGDQIIRFLFLEFVLCNKMGLGLGGTLDQCHCYSPGKKCVLPIWCTCPLPKSTWPPLLSILLAICPWG